jgi:hypothetical protein
MRVNRQLQERAIWNVVVALTLTVGLTAAVVLLRRDSASFAAANKQASYRRVQWRGVCDTIVLGDSRVEIGVSPEDMEAVLIGSTVRNYGFGGVAMTDAYAMAGHAALRSSSPVRRVVVGVTPRMFLASSEAYNNFIEAQRALGSKGDAGSRLALWAETGPLRPMRLEALLEALDPEEPDPPSGEGEESGERWQSYDNGWSSVDTPSPEPDDKLDSYEELFAIEQVEEALVEQFLVHVARWRAEGICVYATRVPVTPELYALENRASGFDHEVFVERFERAGGTWFDFEMMYPTFDGTHLLEAGARQFSRDLAERIAAHEAEGLSALPVGENPDRMTTDE